MADRGNLRIQIFDQEGSYLDECRQFGRPSDVYIDDRDGNVYAGEVGTGNPVVGLTRYLRRFELFP